MIDIVHGDCLEKMKDIEDDYYDCIITSPPYNRKIDYDLYLDNKKPHEYFQWIDEVMFSLKRVLKEDGNFFLNIGSSCSEPLFVMDFISVVRKHFFVQNNIYWIKSITVKDDSYGHFKPVNSDRFLNNNVEHIFHLTKTGKVKINKIAIGVDYQHPSNVTRWSSKKNKRCRGNAWFIPYDTINSKKEKGKHPAIFPEKLVENCIKLADLDERSKVLDPFGGTGTTALVCSQMNINCTSIEIDLSYVNFTKARIKNKKTVF